MMKVPGSTVPASIDWVGSIIMREKKQNKPRIAATYCTECPIKQEHRADFSYVTEDGKMLDVCNVGLEYHLAKECRKL